MRLAGWDKTRFVALPNVRSVHRGRGAVLGGVGAGLTVIR